MSNIYLDRYAWPGPIIKSNPKKGLKIIVVVPCFNEPNVIKTLESLYNCTTPGCFVEVIVVANHSEKVIDQSKQFNQYSADLIEKWKDVHNSEKIETFLIRAFDLPKKHAGVGLARKIGMDEAARRFDKLDDKNGIIVCFDADCECSKNYLVEILQTYSAKPDTNAALVHFEHPLSGEYSDAIYDGIVDYELHLRYYKNALKFTNFPNSYHTVGSCITVTSESYQKQGGMNKRKAGEDFYFLQKIFPHGNIEIIGNATVFPSPRPSDRVPFGTGKAINDIISSDNVEYLTYNPKTFADLKSLIDIIPILYSENDIKSQIEKLPTSTFEFLSSIEFENNVSKLKKNCNSESQFQKALFQWFNGFTVLKYVHFARDNFYPDVEILEAANWVLEKLTNEQSPISDKKTALRILRNMDKSG